MICTTPPEVVIRELWSCLASDVAVLTLGDQGATLSDGDRLLRCAGLAMQPVDRIGAGDAFVAGLPWGWCDGSLDAGLDRGVATSAPIMTLHSDLFTLGAPGVEGLLAGHRSRIDR